MKLTLDQTPETVEINGVTFVQKGNNTPAESSEYKIIRTYSAGVHLAKLEKLEGTTAYITDARVIYSWEGAFTLRELATAGVTKARVTKPVPENILTEAIEIMPCSKQAFKTLLKYEE